MLEAKHLAHRKCSVTRPSFFFFWLQEVLCRHFHMLYDNNPFQEHLWIFFVSPGNLFCSHLNLTLNKSADQPCPRPLHFVARGFEGPPLGKGGATGTPWRGQYINGCHCPSACGTRVGGDSGQEGSLRKAAWNLHHHRSWGRGRHALEQLWGGPLLSICWDCLCLVDKRAWSKCLQSGSLADALMDWEIVHACMCVCVCVCARERERERERRGNFTSFLCLGESCQVK